MYRITMKDLHALLASKQQLKEVVGPDQVWHYNLPQGELADQVFDKLSYNSQTASSGTLFFCKGASFKRDYLAQAVDQGVQVYLSETLYPGLDAYAIIVRDIRQTMALVAKAFYQDPDEKLTLVGITGTKGKTTTSYLLKSILDQDQAGKTAIISTLGISLDGQTQEEASLTTPEALDLYQMIARAQDQGMDQLIMEVSSQAYKMDRVYGLTFDFGAFLNISPDHIGPNEHPDMEDYFYCKSRLVKNSKLALLNDGLDQQDYLKDLSQENGGQVQVYGQDPKACDYYFEVNDQDSRHFTIKSQSPHDLAIGGDYQFEMLGDFNKENALCAALVAGHLGVGQEAIYQGIAQAQVPGRMQHYTYGNNHIYVDFAHNYISLKNLFDFAQDQHPDHSMVVVLGAPGNKGVSRRKDMGHLLSQYQGEVILTEDDPNFETVQAICQEIAQYIDGPIQVTFNDNRINAIQDLLESLTPESQKVILLAAKGSDQYMLRRGVKEDYIGDHKLVEKFLNQQKTSSHEELEG
ncbi:UDP-N-acetylmuramyl-tripeptide synthetase [Alloiococcus otitis]|uniref:UDP-N-acetylmuramyl-tripeptide synthetase n=1 Tax=Alloiococcus otitis TaxID=1652 RepID=UPI0023544D81|nr:UDP-N-acetylmuramyl-tripeptide synthetase [Alloiococcus otitis]